MQEEHKDGFLDSARRERKEESITLSEQVLGVVPLRQCRYQVAFWSDTEPVAAGELWLTGIQELQKTAQTKPTVKLNVFTPTSGKCKIIFVSQGRGA